MKKILLRFLSILGQRARIVTVIALGGGSAYLLFFSLTPRAGGAGSSLTPNSPGDPDMVPQAGGNISKEEYLRKRSEQIAMYRGWEPGKPFNVRARVNAIQEMEFNRALGIRNRTLSPQISDTMWTPIGPAPIPNGQVQCPNPVQGVCNPPLNPTVDVSGRVTSIAVDPTNRNIAYVGTAQGGLYRTVDGGVTWTALMDTAQSLAIGAVTVDPVDRTIVYVGTGEGNQSLDSFWGVGLYRINNANGATPVVNGPFNTRVAGTGTIAAGGVAFSSTAINKIVVDPNDNNRIFVGNTTGFSGISGELTPPGGTTPETAFIGLYFCPNAKSAAPTFSRVDFPTFGFEGSQGITDIVFEPNSSDILLVGVRDKSNPALGLSGIYRTANASAASQNPSVAPNFTKPIALGDVNSKLAIYDDEPGVLPSVVYAATGTGGGRLLRSTDAGATFPTTLAAANGYCGGFCFYTIAVAVDPGASEITGDDIIFLGGAATNAPAYLLQRSTDGGANFADTGTRLHADVHALTYAPNDFRTLYFGSDGGVWRSDDANGATVSFTSQNRASFSAVQFISLAVHPTNPNFTIGGTQDNGTPFRKPDATWTRADFGDGGYSVIDQNAPNNTNVRMYHTYFNSNNPAGPVIGYATVASTANAIEGMWTFRGCSGANGNGINCADATLFYAPLTRGPGNPNTIYFGTDHLYRSTDSGLNHNDASQDPIVNGAVISAIGISPQNDGLRLVGLTNGGIWGAVMGENNLSSLDPVGAGSAVPDKYVARAVIDPTDVDIAYVTLDGYTGAANHVWKTSDLVEHFPIPTWTNASGTGANRIPDVPVNAFVIDPLNPSYLYAGTDIGVYVSTDAGDNWMPLGTGLPRVAVFDMAIPAGSRILRIATHGRGMWDIALPLQLKGGVSRKTHGAAGTFDIPLPGVECRGNGDYVFVLKFTNPITGGTANVTGGTGNVFNITFDGAGEMIIELNGVANAQNLMVTANNVTDTNGNTIDVSINASILTGDVNADGFVNANDISQTKSQSGEEVTKFNFRNDLNVDGSLNSADVSLAKSKSGTALP